jgi:murein L,D-transpeptidase YafK
MTKSNWVSRLAALGLAASLAAMLAGCEGDELAGGSGRSLRPISPETIALMGQNDTSPSQPVLIRTFKKEAEFEIWKMKSDGRYALLKTYPMCRWSGQLGPKTREGDRQVPEGFYPITPGQMNPNSNYYLSFNVGYPNAYDRAFGRTGGTIMVHGACSSAGCFSMTDAQIAEIYAIARDAFNGGQREIQMQSYPFHMTAENLAKHRLDPNIEFWKQLKNGSDHFEVTRTEPEVGVCAKHYVFGAHGIGDSNASAACPVLQRDAEVEAAVAAKQSHDDEAVAQLVAQGVKPIELVYDDGGQNPSFVGQKGDVSRPDAITAGPTEIVLDEKTGQPIPAVVKIAAASEAQRVVSAPAAANAPAQTLVAQAPPASGQVAPVSPLLSPLAIVGGATDTSSSFVKKWLNFGAEANDSAVKVYEPAQPVPSDVPLPPRRDAAGDSTAKPQASLKTQSFAAMRTAVPAQAKPNPGSLALAGAPLQQ